MRRKSLDQVWIVQQDATPNNTALGVFDHGGAYAFAKETKDGFSGHIVLMQFQIGYKFTDGSSCSGNSRWRAVDGGAQEVERVCLGGAGPRPDQDSGSRWSRY